MNYNQAFLLFGAGSSVGQASPVAPGPKKLTAISPSFPPKQPLSSQIPTVQLPLPPSKPKVHPKINLGGVNTAGLLQNNGPFSPSIFTLKRVWVKRPGGTPTTVQVHQNDIVDDLKQEVVNKFPTSLGRSCDPADLVLKMDISKAKQHQTLLQLQPQPQQLVQLILTLLQNQDYSRSLQTLGQSQFAVLEPDQNVWSLLDVYFPTGMTMHDSLTIETPLAYDPIEPPYQQSQLQPQPQLHHPLQLQFSRSLNGAIHGVGSPDIYSPLHAQYTPFSENFHFNGPRNAINSLQNQQLLVLPTVLQQNQANNRPNNSYQPRASSTEPNFAQSVSKDRSVSPIARSTGANTHRQSVNYNPPQSPSTASQAVLLLPKNYSLGGVGNANTNNSKPTSVTSTDMTTSNSSGIAGTGAVIESSDTDISATPTETGAAGTSPSPTIVGSKSQPLFKETDSKKPTPPRLQVELESRFKNIEPTTTQSRTNSESKQDQKDVKSSSSTERKISDSEKNGKPPSNPRSETNGSLTTSNNSSTNNSNSKLSNSPSKGVATTTTDKVLPSISVLVVEDNAINQAILGAFLRKHKIQYKIAKNGQEAVDKWKEGGFHLVLMDIQLPVKSGIEATKEIRHLERVNNIGVFAETADQEQADTPADATKLDLKVFKAPVIIVALTASSNSSVDRKNALMAGCNDYLTKPVNLVWLQNKITEWGCMQALIDFDGWKDKRLHKV